MPFFEGDQLTARCVGFQAFVSGSGRKLGRGVCSCSACWIKRAQKVQLGARGPSRLILFFNEKCSRVHFSSTRLMVEGA